MLAHKDAFLRLRRFCVRPALRITLFACCGPLLLLLFQMPVTLMRLVASLVVSASCTAAVVAPRRLSSRFGKFGGLFVVMLLGALIGVLLAAISAECSIWSAPCRSTLGSWILVGMLIPVCFAMFRRVTEISVSGVRSVVGLFRKTQEHARPVPVKSSRPPHRSRKRP